MKTSTKQARNFRPKIGRIVMALAFASVMGGIAVTPALGDNDDRQGHRDNDNRQGHQDNGRHNDERQGDRDRHEYQPAYQQSYYYSEPVYAPPPVYYAPQESPGISLFFDIR